MRNIDIKINEAATEFMEGVVEPILTVDVKDAYLQAAHAWFETGVVRTSSKAIALFKEFLQTKGVLVSHAEWEAFRMDLTENYDIDNE